MLLTDTNLPAERERVQQLIAMVPVGLSSALDVGAADCHIAALLADRIPSVTAVDVEQPQTSDARVRTVQGDVTSLAFGDKTFDMVVCSQVIEHIEPALLQKACDELSRVAGRFALIAVPYRQDIRFGRMTCSACGARNYPYGHLSSFDEQRLHVL
ncbi:MAG: class I SAM-dependent methyltransferase, partial [Patescibacteria group bacterium]|nr:class I SAM-dependent methyltransferase [Patescibacteria group bacterium]